MATITSAQSGNFSDTATWVGGVVPGVSDDAVAATGHTVDIDVDTTVISVQQAGTGKFTLGNGRTLTANVIANAGTFTSGGTVDVTATTTAVINGNVTGVSTTTANTAGVVMTGTGALTINGSVTGSPGNASSIANGSAAIYTNVTNAINVNGNISGGPGFEKRGCQSGPASNTTWTIIGDITSGGTGSIGGNKAGLLCEGTTTVSITGNLTAGLVGIDDRAVSVLGGSVSVTGDLILTNGNRSACLRASGNTTTVSITGNCLAPGLGPIATCDIVVVSGSAASVTITGNITVTAPSGGFRGINITSTVGPTVNMIGTATAGPGTDAHAIECVATTANTGVIFQGNMVDSSSGTKAIRTRIFRMTATNSGYTQYQNNVGWPLGTPVYRVSPDNVIGMPAQANVRKPVVYGYSNQLTGAMAVPSAGSVAYGVPVDNTAGTAEFDLGRVAEIIGLQVAAGKSV